MTVLPPPFNGAGSHLPSWNSKLLGREWGGEEGYTHAHIHTHTLLTPTSVEKFSLSRDPFVGYLFCGADIKLGVIADQLEVGVAIKGCPLLPSSCLGSCQPHPRSGCPEPSHMCVCARLCRA